MDAEAQNHCTAFKGARCIASGELAEVAVKAKAAVDKGEQVLIFDDTTSESIELDFRGSSEDVLRRLARPDSREAAAVSERRARPRPPETRRRRARGHAAAPALGVAQRPAGRGIGGVAQAGGGGAARERGQGPRPAIAGSRLSLHVRHGRQPAGIRGGDARLVCRSSRALRAIGRAVAPGCSRSRKKARRRRARRRHPGAAPLLKS